MDNLSNIRRTKIMIFNKEKFIKEKGQKAYSLLLDFLSEESNLLCYKELEFLMLENIRSFEYESNVYWITKFRDDDKIHIIDEVTETHGCPSNFTRFSLDKEEFIAILKEAKEIIKSK